MVSTGVAYLKIRDTLVQKYGGTIVSTRGSLTEGLDLNGDPFKYPQNHVTTRYPVATLPCYSGSVVFGIEWVTLRLGQVYQAVVQLEKEGTRLATVFIDLMYGLVREVDISPKSNGHLDDLASIKGMGLEEGVNMLFEKICQNRHQNGHL